LGTAPCYIHSVHSPLARFVRRQIDLRRETVKEYALRAGLNPSGIAQLLRGERDWVQSETLAKIAAAAGMTEAEMFQAMASEEPNPAKQETIDLALAVPDENRATANALLRALIEPVTANSAQHTPANAPKRRVRTRTSKGDDGTGGPLTRSYPHTLAALAVAS